MTENLKIIKNAISPLILTFVVYLAYRCIWLIFHQYNLPWANSYYIAHIFCLLFLFLIILYRDSKPLTQSEILWSWYTILIIAVLYVCSLVIVLFDLLNSFQEAWIVGIILSVITIAFGIVVEQLKRKNRQIIPGQAQPDLLKQYLGLRKPLLHTEFTGAMPRFISPLIIAEMVYFFIMLLFMLFTAVIQYIYYPVLDLIQFASVTVTILGVVKLVGTRHPLEKMFICFGIFFTMFVYGLILLYNDFGEHITKAQFTSVLGLVTMFLTMITIGFILFTALYNPTPIKIEKPEN